MKKFEYDELQILENFITNEKIYQCVKSQIKDSSLFGLLDKIGNEGWELAETIEGRVIIKREITL